MDPYLGIRSLLRRLGIGLGAGCIVAGLGLFLFTRSVRDITPIPPSIQEEAFRGANPPMAFAWNNAGLKWHASVAWEVTFMASAS
jgi:hypothetical protein